MNIKQKFNNAIRCGTGETHRIIKENPTVDFSKEIIKGALTNFAYDQQSEGSRDVYIAELIELSSKKETILPIIYEALKNDERNNWSTSHLFDIVAIFAKQGDQIAKESVYQCFDKYALQGEWFGDYAIFEIDGLNGLLYVARKKGEFFTNNSEEWEDSFFVDSFQEENPEIDVYGELRNSAENNSHIKKYLEMIEENKFAVYQPNKDKKEKYDYKYVKDRFKNKYLGIGPRIFENLPRKDLKKLANDFLKETKRLRQEKYLRIFACVKFPYDYQPILELAKAKVRKTDRLVEFAVESLQFFRGKDIRQFALEKLSNTNEPEIYTNFLIGNYRKGDWKLLESIAEKAKNNDVIESLAISYIDIYQANQTKECREPLEVIYEKMNCGLHRTKLVRILIENNVLSNKIRNEIQFDCEEGTRKLFESILEN